MYHEVLDAVTAQAFPVFYDSTMKTTLSAGKDAFAINYGTGGIAAEVYANRIGVGPMGSCVDCKFEEFFLSAWSVGDPAMLVDRPANFSLKQPPPPSPAQPPLTPQPPAPPPCTTADFEGVPATSSNARETAKSKLCKRPAAKFQRSTLHPGWTYQGDQGLLSGRSVKRLSQLHQRSSQVQNSSRWHRRQPRPSPACTSMAAVAEQRSRRLSRQPDDQPGRELHARDDL